jgi:molybdopterin adenylyltransferase
MDDTESADDEGSIDTPICVGVITVATDRSLDTDAAGETIESRLEADGCEVAIREHVSADHDTVQTIVSRLIDRDDVELIVTSGATSIEPNDVTLDAVEPLLTKELTAFSELFTMLSYDAFGSHAVAARALGGVVEEVPVFCLPGNHDAVRLALDEIIVPEAAHLVRLARPNTSVSEPAIRKELDGGDGDDDGR